MEYEKICNEILESDKKIRYVGAYDYGELYDKMRPGLKSHLSKEETELSLSQAVYRWSTRKKTAGKIGKTISENALLTALEYLIAQEIIVVNPN